MQVVNAYPPLMDQIDTAFHTRGQAVLYSWGHKLYVPIPMQITDAMIEHERVHGKRQGDDVEGWWLRYIADPAFRLAEEIPAHRAEWEWHARQPGADKPRLGWRSGKHYHLHYIAKRLASPLYGGIISLADAKREISNGRC